MVLVLLGGKEMGAEKDMTPVVFKNGRDFGKVI